MLEINGKYFGKTQRLRSSKYAVDLKGVPISLLALSPRTD